MRGSLLFVGLILLASPSFGQTDGVELSKEAVVKCADAGVAECQFRLARMTETGDQVQKDLVAAKRLYELAYRNGYAPAGDAILRLAKTSPQTPTMSGQSSTEAAQLSHGPDNPTSYANPTAKGELAFFPDGKPAGIGPLYLGQSEQSFAQAVPQADCQRSQGGYRTCQGTLTLENGAAYEVFAVFDKRRAAAISAMVPSGCLAMVSTLSSRFPEASPLVTKLMAATVLKELAQDLPPDLELTAWTEKGAWSAFTMCDPADESGMVVLANGRMVQQ